MLLTLEKSGLLLRLLFCLILQTPRVFQILNLLLFSFWGGGVVVRVSLPAGEKPKLSSQT